MYEVLFFSEWTMRPMCKFIILGILQNTNLKLNIRYTDWISKVEKKIVGNRTRKQKTVQTYHLKTLVYSSLHHIFLKLVVLCTS